MILPYFKCRKSHNTGFGNCVNQDIAKWYSFNINTNAYYNQIDAFHGLKIYILFAYFSGQTNNFSGNVKLNNLIFIYRKLWIAGNGSLFSTDIIPQGKNRTAFSLDLGLKNLYKRGKKANCFKYQRPVKYNGF